MSREGENSEELPGNAPIETKEHIQNLVDIFKLGFGARTTQHLKLVEVSVVPKANEPTRQEARVVLEMTVTEDMLNPGGNLHGGCIALLVDICTTLPIVALSVANGGEGSVEVSQSINIIYHAPASPGDTLRLVNTSTTSGTRTQSARIEMWDATHHRLVATATQVKMEALPSKL